MVTNVTPDDAPGWVVERLGPGPWGTRWIGIDGLGAAGKSTLAARVSAALPGSVVVPIDHFGRAGLRGWDRELFVSQVVEPVLAERPGRYRRWDLVADRALGWTDVPSGTPLIVEGVSATDVRLPVPWDLRIWVAASEDVRRARIAERDGADLLERWRSDWWPSEEAYAQAQNPSARADAIVG